MVGIPLPAAFVLSLALHAALLALAGGSPAIRAGRAPHAAPAAAKSGPAPLTVRLSIERVAPARIEMGLPPAVAPVELQAPVIGDEGAGKGGGSRPETPDAEPARDAGAPLAGLPVPLYFEAAELTRRAEILRDIDPDPPGLHGRKGPSRFVLSLYINESGRVDRVEFESPEPEAALRAALVESFLAATFRPAERDGAPVKSRMRVEASIRPLMKY